MNWDLLLTDCRAATMADSNKPYGAIEDAAIAIAGGKIAWIGTSADLPAGNARETVKLGGRWVTPGLIDCHTHLVYGGDRAAEFELRLKGATYEEIAKAGGGIASTVKATRTASLDDLVAASAPRLASLMAEGVTIIEIKSGYGLDLENERKQLRAARKLGEAGNVTVRTTCLAAHALPPEFSGNSDGYIDTVCNEILPAIAKEGLADAVRNRDRVRHADARLDHAAGVVRDEDRQIGAGHALQHQAFEQPVAHALQAERDRGARPRIERRHVAEHRRRAAAGRRTRRDQAAGAEQHVGAFPREDARQHELLPDTPQDRIRRRPRRRAATDARVVRQVQRCRCVHEDVEIGRGRQMGQQVLQIRLPAAEARGQGVDDELHRGADEARVTRARRADARCRRRR